MQTTIASVTRQDAAPLAQSDVSHPIDNDQWASYNIIRRNGSVVGFKPSKIAIAMTKAFLAVNGGQGAASARVRELVEQLTGQVVSALVRNRPAGEQICTAALQLPSRGAAQGKAPAAIFHQPMYFVEQHGNSLNFIDHNPLIRPPTNNPFL